MPANIEPQNLLFLLSDEHNSKIAGCYGHPFVNTPNIDRLAASGARFASAYCNSPICVPSRASLATGRHVHEIGYWDNASPYDGLAKSWHAHLRENAVDVVSIGKLHFRGGEGDDYGFSETLIPLNVVGGKGDLKGLFRKDLPPKKGAGDLARDAGRGDSSYSSYDRTIAATAQDWLAKRAASGNSQAFVLFVSFVMPHFPLIAPGEFYDLYEQYDLDTLRHRLQSPAHDHPTLDRMRAHFNYDAHFTDEKRAMALRAYYGMVTMLDKLIGDVIASLDKSSFADNTRIIYASDHGDNLGSHGMWGKSVMYEDSVAVPIIMAGKDVPAGKVVNTPVSLIDIAPTAAHATGVDASGENYPGRSLIDIANSADEDRVVFSQYHAAGSDTGQFMIRKGKWKYVAYAGERPQLFDLAADPDETTDLWDDPACKAVLDDLDAELRKQCDPDEVNARAFADQQRLIDANGGREVISSTVDIPYTPAPA